MRRTTPWLLVLVAVATLAAACGNSGDDTSAEDTSSTTTAAPSGGDSTTTAAGGSARDTFVSISGVPGVSDDEIAFDVIGTKSNNPLGTCILDCYRDGIQAYFDFRNDEGGIYGRQLVIKDVLDDELSQNQVRAIDVISNNDAFGDFNATLLASGWGDLDKAGVPTFTWNINATEATDRKAIFPAGAVACAGCVSRGVPYLVKLAGAKKVASLGYGVSENSKVCAQTNKASIEQYSADIGGAEVAYFNDQLAFGLPNGIGPEVSAMKDAGVDFIATCIDLNGMKTLGQELHRQGMDDVVMAHPNTYNQDFVKAAGGIFEGDYISAQFLPFEADSGNALQAAFKKYMGANDKELSELAMVGFINADEAFSALMAAGPDFDRQKAIDAFNQVTDYSAGGLIQPIDWTTGHTPATPGEPAQGLSCFAPVKVVDSAFQTVADPKTPFFCWDSSSLDWSEPKQMAFGDN